MQLDEGDNEVLFMCFYIIINNYYEYLPLYEVCVCLSCEKYIINFLYSHKCHILISLLLLPFSQI